MKSDLSNWVDTKQEERPAPSTAGTFSGILIDVLLALAIMLAGQGAVWLILEVSCGWC